MLKSDVSKVANFRELCYIEVDDELQMNPVTQAIIFELMAVDMQGITEDNYLDFYKRSKMQELIYGGPLINVDTNERVGISLKNVKEHIGVTVNVVTITFTAFSNQWKRNMIDKVELQIKEELKESMIEEYGLDSA